VDLCLFDDRGRERRVAMPERSFFVWHCRLPGIGPGQRYGYRVHGPWAPERGVWCNPAKLLIDPYAKAVDGGVDWDRARAFAYVAGTGSDPVPARDPEDSSPAVPKSVVVDPSFDWRGDRAPRVPWQDTVIYECHVKGLTMRHPGVPEHLRGTYAGLGCDQVVGYLRRLGVTAVELLPVHHFITEPEIAERGLVNYWGYSSIGYLAPHAAYSASGVRGQQVREFKEMVRALHAAGIEVILDVVYNHTAEGGHLGPTLAFRGIDNPSYYRLFPGDPRHYLDFTGCGNSLNPVHPSVLRLIMDSLRYWVTEMHVDGFRFDLAAALARELYDVDRLSSFLDTIHQDPVLSQVKLIAEPWDLGEGGYQVGQFPVLWTEWNGKYRDAVRDFWRGTSWGVGELGTRLTGSSDLYGDDGRRPLASVNFVTCHDGFTLADLTSYEHKHNEANGEGNRDGTDDNRSSNAGVEGPTDDPDVLALRGRRARAMLATLLLSQGVPMLLAGDEVGRTQRGNNNTYCQDNALSWLDWDVDDDRRALAGFVRRLISLRRAHPVFRRRHFFDGGPGGPRGLADISWLREDGRPMLDADWHDPARRTVAFVLNGDAMPGIGPDGEPIRDDTFLVAINGDVRDHALMAPPERFGRRWTVQISSADPTVRAGSRGLGPGDVTPLPGPGVLVLRRTA
jgi:glycogen operon protein